ncbi:MAG: hypothetical protein JXB29_11460 [Sedimentisphaerales bacterium]|nr:hypothetical protein [Sedimentisphaerales bacterium]
MITYRHGKVKRSCLLVNSFIPLESAGQAAEKVFIGDIGDLIEHFESSIEGRPASKP